MSSNDSQPKLNASRILVVRLGAMGDVIHALPAAAALARALPEAKVDWIVEPRWADLLEGNPYVGSVVPFPLKAWRKRPFSPQSWGAARLLIGELRSNRYDLVVDLQGLIKSACLARLTGCPRRVGFERSALREPFAARFYTEQVAVSGEHVVDKNLSAVRRLVGNEDTAAEFPLPEGEYSAALPSGDFVLTSPVAGWGSKQWPSRHYAQLAGLIREGLGMQLVLDCAPGDVGYVQEIARSAPAESVVVHSSTIPQLIGATRRARAVVGVDSGPLHLAAALNKAGVAVFGPTDPARNGPYGGTLTVLRATTASTSYRRDADVSCAMSSISAAQVYDKLCRRMSATRD
jgi:heptosyltransferase-1